VKTGAPHSPCGSPRARTSLVVRSQLVSAASAKLKPPV